MEQQDVISRGAKAAEWIDEESALQADSRANVYEFLSRIYLEEISPEFLKALRDPGCREALDRLGIAFFRETGRRENAELLEELAAAFCSTFLVSQDVALYPYESCQRDGCLQGNSTHVVQCFLQKCGMELPEDSGEFSDHLGVEFDFMAKLAREESRWWQLGQNTAAERRRKQQKDFLGNHLLVWVPRYGKTVERSAAHSFYREIGRLTSDFMDMESKGFS